MAPPSALLGRVRRSPRLRAGAASGSASRDIRAGRERAARGLGQTQWRPAAESASPSGSVVDLGSGIAEGAFEGVLENAVERTDLECGLIWYWLVTDYLYSVVCACPPCLPSHPA